MTTRFAAIALFALAAAAPARASQLAIGPGSSADLGGSTVDLGCGDLSIEGGFTAASGAVAQAGDVDIAASGTLDGGSATLEVTGDWTRTGTFSPGASLVRFVDGCGHATTTVSGWSTFANLELDTASGKTFSFESGATTSVTGSFAVAGAPGNLAKVRATVGGNAAFLDLQGGATQSVSYVDVQDNHAIGTPIALDGTSTVSGNAFGWITSIVVPALGLVGTLALATFLATAALTRGARTRSR